MKHALISPLEAVENGYRIVQVEEQEFPVCPPLFWVAYTGGEDIFMELFDPVDQTIKPRTQEVPLGEISPADEQPNVSGAQNL